MQITRRGLLAQMGLVAASGVLPSLTRGGTPAGFSIHDALIWDDHSGFDPVPDYDLEHLEDWRQAGVNYLSIDVGYDVIEWERAIKTLTRIGAKRCEKRINAAQIHLLLYRCATTGT
jgi:hypothetical protein